MVFGAFWMVPGAACLIGVLTAFTKVLVQIKDRERKDPAEVKLMFYEHLNRCSVDLDELSARGLAKKDQQGFDAYGYLKLGVLIQGLVTKEEMEHIERRWEYLEEQSETR